MANQIVSVGESITRLARESTSDVVSSMVEEQQSEECEEDAARTDSIHRVTLFLHGACRTTCPENCPSPDSRGVHDSVPTLVGRFYPLQQAVNDRRRILFPGPRRVDTKPLLLEQALVAWSPICLVVPAHR